MLVKIETKKVKCEGRKFQGFSYSVLATVEKVTFHYITTAETTALNRNQLVSCWRDLTKDSYYYNLENQTFRKCYGDLDVDHLNDLAQKLEDLPVIYTDDPEGGKNCYKTTIDTEPRQSEGIISIFITNLGYYNSGILSGEWIGLPATETQIQECLDRIGIDELNEEYFISDYESEIDGLNIGEYSSIAELNEMAEELAELDSDEQTVFSALLEGGHGQFEECLNIVTAGNYTVYCGAESMEDVAYQIIESSGKLDNAGLIASYFDYKGYGRDLAFSGFFYPSDLGMVEVIQ